MVTVWRLGWPTNLRSVFGCEPPPPTSGKRGGFNRRMGGKFPQPMPLSHKNATMLAMHAPTRQGGLAHRKGEMGV